MGLFTSSCTPSALANALEKAVLPAPKSPSSPITLPEVTSFAKKAANLAVAFKSPASYINCAEARTSNAHNHLYVLLCQTPVFSH
ncbi:hypothetical protein D3C77_590580 [compost metagenome]